MDDQTTVKQLRDQMRDFVKARDWEKYHQPKNLAMSIAIEAAELMEHFQWLNDQAVTDQLKNPQTKEQIAEELADIIHYCLSFANATQIDISEAVSQKMLKNQSRFPIGSDYQGK